MSRDGKGWFTMAICPSGRFLQALARLRTRCRKYGIALAIVSSLIPCCCCRISKVSRAWRRYCPELISKVSAGISQKFQHRCMERSKDYPLMLRTQTTANAFWCLLGSSTRGQKLLWLETRFREPELNWNPYCCTRSSNTVTL